MSAPFLNIQIHGYISASHLEADDKGHNFSLCILFHLFLNAVGRAETVLGRWVMLMTTLQYPIVC